MKNVLLINPDPVPRVLPPLGICYIAESLKKNGHNPIIFDMGFDKKLDIEGIDLICITATTLIYFDAKSVVKQVKEINKDIPVILGGAHASLLPEFVITDSGCDAVVIGEGEEIIVKIANGDVEPKGIIQAPMIVDVDSIPFPTYSYVNINRYFNYRGTDRIRWSLPQPSISMIGTRGCPFSCTFCASKSLFGRKVRFRSLANIMEEIDYLIQTYQIKSIYFYDDTLTIKKKWMEDLCRELSKRKIKWICGTRVDTVDETMLRIMKDSGCKYISYGVESGSNRVLKDIIKKGTTIEQVEKIIKLTDKIGIGIIANYMFGLPGETQKDLQATLDAVKRIPADAAELSIFIPLPGTELAGELDWTKYDSTKNPYHQKSTVHSSDFSETIKKYHRKAVWGFYFSPKFIIRQKKMFFQPRQLFFAGKSLLYLVKELVKIR